MQKDKLDKPVCITGGLQGLQETKFEHECVQKYGKILLRTSLLESALPDQA